MAWSRKAVVSSVLVLFISVYFGCLLQQHPGDDEPTPEDLIRGHGYPVESHDVVTEDGYILRLHRIPHGKSTQGPARRRPVLISHGLTASSAVWVLFPSALGVMLADAGFDVWLLNQRGNSFSRRHLHLDPDKDMQFWNFSIHEYGYYDLAAGMDYVLAATGQARLLYVGQSMGATSFLVLGATRPQYMQKVQAVMLMAPAAFFSKATSPLVRFLGTSGISLLTWLHKTLGVHEVFPYRIAGPWSRKTGFVKDVVMRILNNACGEDDANQLQGVISVIMQHFPAGTSYNVLLHFGQIYEKGFNYFDHGAEVNQRVYGTPEAPAYNLSNVRAPVHVFYAPNDWIVIPQDIMYTTSRLPDVRSVTKVPKNSFNHADFVLSPLAGQLVNEDVIKMFNSYPDEIQMENSTS